jgi:hypothetical protein
MARLPISNTRGDTDNQPNAPFTGNLNLLPGALRSADANFTELYGAYPGGTAPTATTAAKWSDTTGTALVKPDGTPTTLGGGVNNANNGQDFELVPQSNTGLNAIAAKARFSYTAGTFTGNVYNDAVASIGYNVDSGAGISSTTFDTFAAGAFFESNYEYTAISGTATAATTTTLTDSGKAWGVNQYAGYSIYITSGAASGQSKKITSNTATVLTFPAIAGLTGTPTYQILEDDMETYLQWSQNEGTYRSFRPIFFSFDRGRAKVQAALGTNGALTISSATAANPIVVTTSVNHGLKAGTLSSVKLAGMAGGTWSTLNGYSFTVTVTGANTFTIGFNGTGLGVYTGSSGTATEDPAMAASWVEASTLSGFEIRRASWATSSFDDMAVFLPSRLNLTPERGTDYILALQAGVGNSGQLIQYSNNVVASLFSPGTNFFQFGLYDSGGANLTTCMYLYRTPNGGNAGGSISVGGANDNGAVGTFSNTANSNNVKGIVIRANAAQAANLLEFQQSNGTTVTAFLDQSSNFVPYGAQTAPATTDTNGFQYIAKVAGAPTGVPANLAGNYANAVPMRYDTTNNKLWIYNGAWRGVVLA